ncbi:Alpha/Beta hydrolase protein [Mycena metata]|uniref:Alpha/Beta hydrolase protein n=1 Tax=Mycena metata TaxID=1033252 RepID=A0AAD7N6D4_9AGAR|nr:Alpha/Beta hydrolase protein [Mycena metata]
MSGTKWTFIVPQFQLECGVTLLSPTVCYQSWGTLNHTRNNGMVICHPFTGSVDVEKWWGPLLGAGKAFDPMHYFIICANVLGSPFGTASPLSIDSSTGRRYGPDFPPTTIRDDVRLHKLVLDHLGITSVAVVVGGSMGGMTALEWPLCFPGLVQRIIPLATCAKQSAWCIAWGEAKRQIIYTDSAFRGGHYPRERPPKQGLAAARMVGLVTYRSCDSYEQRFGRKLDDPSPHVPHPHQKADDSTVCSTEKTQITVDPAEHPRFSAQSYLHYKGATFATDFDANCYIHLTHKMDTHDITRGRMSAAVDIDEHTALSAVLRTLPPHPLIISISSDVLCPPHEQKILADGIPEAELVVIDSMAGHDGFLVEGERIDAAVVKYLRREFPEFYR